MTETLRYSKIFLEDLAIGDSTQAVRMSDGRQLTLSEINFSNILSSDPTSTLENSAILFTTAAGALATDATNLGFNDTTNVANIASIAGGTSASDDLTLDSTSNATKGNIFINPAGGSIGIGLATTPDELIHVANSGNVRLKLDNTNTGTTGDVGILFELSEVGATSYFAGIDNSDSDRFFIGVGSAISNADAVITVDGAASPRSVGIGDAATTPVAVLEVGATSAGAITPDTDGDDLFVQSSGDTGITIGCPATNTGSILFADTGDSDIGGIRYSHTSNFLAFDVNASERLRIDSSGQMLLNETANTFSTQGLTINIAANTDEAVSLKNSSVAHGITTLSETDTFALLTLADSNGGVALVGQTGSEVGAEVIGRITTEDTGSLTSSSGAVELRGETKSGTTTAAMAAGANMVVFSNAGTARTFMRGNGDWEFLAGDVTVTAGNLVVTAGNIEATTGDINVLIGDIIATAGQIFIGDASDVNNTGGLVINQGALDDDILSLKSSDVAHGITDEAETDTFLGIHKASATAGGAVMRAYTEGNLSYFIQGFATTEITTDTSASLASIMINPLLKSGTTGGDHGATANIFGVRNNTTTHLLIKGNGDIHATNTTLTALDDYDDVALLTAYRAGQDPALIPQLGPFFDQYEEILLEKGVIFEKDERGNRMFSYPRLMALTIDALRQTANRVAQLESRLYLTDQS